MGNQSGKVFGLTLVCPIIDDDRAVPSHDLQIRYYLATLPTGADSPFAVAPGTHLARLVVLDDVIYVGMPSCEEHLKSKYLVMEVNCDSDVDGYFGGLMQAVPDQVDAIWSHCVGYPGKGGVPQFVAYMRACQIETTFFFAAVNDKSEVEVRKALETQRAVGDFIASHQGMGGAELQQEFLRFLQVLDRTPPLPAGTPPVARGIKTGGHNE